MGQLIWDEGLPRGGRGRWRSFLFVVLVFSESLAIMYCGIFLFLFIFSHCFVPLLSCCNKVMNFLHYVETISFFIRCVGGDIIHSAIISIFVM